MNFLMNRMSFKQEYKLNQRGVTKAFLSSSKSMNHHSSTIKNVFPIKKPEVQF